MASCNLSDSCCFLYLSFLLFTAVVCCLPSSLLSRLDPISSISSINETHEETPTTQTPNPLNPTSLSVKFPETEQIFNETDLSLTSCNIFDGNWVTDDSSPVYPPGSCPFLDDAFNCFKNGRPDWDFLKWRWEPNGCSIPRFNGKQMLEMLRGKRLVFVGDSLNRNMWQSMVCALRESLIDKTRVLEVSGAAQPDSSRRNFKTGRFYAFRFEDYNCSIEFVKAPFLVQEWKTSIPNGPRKETLRLDLIQKSSSIYVDADIIIFNTGHWWTHEKTSRGKNYYQEGDYVHAKLDVTQAYTKALHTWAKWVDTNINPNRTRVFFRGYSASHFRKGRWDSGGHCHGETKPVTNNTYLKPYQRMMDILESVLKDMKTPVRYLNITKMSDYRTDGHPSIYRYPGAQRSPQTIQDCSHWCLPGVPDAWNQLLYTALLLSPQASLSSFS